MTSSKDSLVTGDYHVLTETTLATYQGSYPAITLTKARASKSCVYMVASEYSTWLRLLVLSVLAYVMNCNDAGHGTGMPGKPMAPLRIPSQSQGLPQIPNGGSAMGTPPSVDGTTAQLPYIGNDAEGALFVMYGRMFLQAVVTAHLD